MSAMRNINIGQYLTNTNTPATKNTPAGVTFMDLKENNRSESEKSLSSQKSIASNKQSARMLNALDNLVQIKR